MTAYDWKYLAGLLALLLLYALAHGLVATVLALLRATPMPLKMEEADEQIRVQEQRERSRADWIAFQQRAYRERRKRDQDLEAEIRQMTGGAK